MISESFRFISTLFLTVFAYLKRTIITTYIYSFIALLSVSMNYLFVPQYGSEGSAIVSVSISLVLITIVLKLNNKYEFK